MCVNVRLPGTGTDKSVTTLYAARTESLGCWRDFLTTNLVICRMLRYVSSTGNKEKLGQSKTIRLNMVVAEQSVVDSH